MSDFIDRMRQYRQSCDSIREKSLELVAVLKEWSLQLGKRGGKVWINESGKKRYGKKPGSRDKKTQKDEDKKASKFVVSEVLNRVRGGGKLNGHQVAALGRNLKTMSFTEIKSMRDALGGVKVGRSKQEMMDGLVQKARQAVAKKKRVAVRKDTLAAYIRSIGGINPNDHTFRTVYGSMKEAIENGVPLVVFRTNQREGLDVIAESMAASGMISVPDGRHPQEVLLERLAKGAKLSSDEMEDKFKKQLEEYNQSLQEVRSDGSIQASEIEETLRRGEADARGEVTNELLEEHFGEYRGGTDFDFGANVEEKPVSQVAVPLGRDDIADYRRVAQEKATEFVKVKTSIKRTQKEIDRLAKIQDDIKSHIQSANKSGMAVEQRFIDAYAKNAVAIDKATDKLDKLKSSMRSHGGDWRQIMAEMIVADHPAMYQRSEQISADGTPYLGYSLKAS